MSGGIAFVNDKDDDFHIRFNDDMADLEQVVDPEDIEMLQDLIMAAVNEAARKVDEKMSQQMGGVTDLLGGLG